MNLTFRSSIKLAPADAIVEAAATDGLRDVAVAELAESTRLVPVESGALRDSGRVSTDGLRAAVSYSADYAVFVHERLDVNHPDGQAKFLENAQDSIRRRADGIIAAPIRRRL